MTVDRYEPNDKGEMEFARRGDWVSHDDYAALENQLSDLECECGDAIAERDQLRAQVADYEARSKSTYCAYCGQAFLLDTEAAEQVSNHIRTCEKHPMRAVERERDRFAAALVRMAMFVRAVPMSDVDDATPIAARVHDEECRAEAAEILRNEKESPNA